MDKVAVLSPVPPLGEQRIELSPRPASLDGLTIGLLGNLKPNADRLLRQTGALLVEHGAKLAVFHEKDNCSAGASQFLLDDVASGCDIALTAVGDCGSCTTWCVNDAIELERRHTPATAFVTSPFQPMVEYELAALGFPDLAISEVTTYPFQGLTEEEVAAVAKAALPNVLSALLSRG